MTGLKITLFLSLMNSFLQAAEVVAHRGASMEAPENTLPAFKRAIELNCHYIEIDVQQTLDGEVVVIHDTTVDRTANGSGMVKEMELAELKSLDAGSWFSEKFAGEKIPTLREVLSLDLKRSKLIVEIKNQDNRYPGIEKKVALLIKESGKAESVIVKSFSGKTLKKLRGLLPKAPTIYVTLGPIIDGLLIIDEWIRFGSLFDVEADYYQVHRFFVSRELIEQVQTKGKKLIVWDVHEEEDIEKMIKLGVNIIETDFPQRIPRRP